MIASQSSTNKGRSDGYLRKKGGKTQRGELEALHQTLAKQEEHLWNQGAALDRERGNRKEA